MSKDIHGRTRLQWLMQWLMWWVAVAIFVFLAYQLSRPLWDANKLILEKQQSCQNAGLVMAQQKVTFGINYYCTPKEKI